MTGEGKKLQPIIIKRVKKGGHGGAHGGTWKIAYADFVTAMMAFFLLLWLLGSTAEGDLDGIASYFASPVKVTLMGGDGSGASDSILPGGGRDLSKAAGQVDGGDAERAAKLMGAQMARAERARQDALRIAALERKISALIASSPQMAEFASQIRLDKTADGLYIQIVDQRNRPMFDTGSAAVKPHMRDILRAIGATLVDVENRIVLAGHTDAMPFVGGVRGFSNWELSADRANASRRELVAGGLPDESLLRVEGLASSRPLLPEQPNDPTNRRIGIVVLTQEAEARLVPLFQTGAPAAAAAPERSSTPAAPSAGPPAVLPRLQIAPELTTSIPGTAR